MKIGIKYCGGCNPRHDRSHFVKRITQAYEAVHQFEIAREGTVCDALLLIGGCTNCCADFSQIQVKERVIRIMSERDFQEVVNYLDHNG